MTEAEHLRDIMINAIEAMQKYVCHTDIPESEPNFDAHFTIVSDPDEPVYTVLIKRIEL